MLISLQSPHRKLAILPAKRANDSCALTTGTNLTNAEPKHSFNGWPNFPKNCPSYSKPKACALQQNCFKRGTSPQRQKAKARAIPITSRHITPQKSAPSWSS
jgi:hypothetical protein